MGKKKIAHNAHQEIYAVRTRWAGMKSEHVSVSVYAKYTVARKSGEMQGPKGIIGAINHLSYHLCLRTQWCAFGNVKSLSPMV